MIPLWAIVLLISIISNFSFRILCSSLIVIFFPFSYMYMNIFIAYISNIYIYIYIYLYLSIYLSIYIYIVVVQLPSWVQLLVTPWTAAHQASLSFTICLELAQTHVHWVDDAIQPSCHLSSPSPPVINLSQHKGPFQWVISSHQEVKLLELQL